MSWPAYFLKYFFLNIFIVFPCLVDSTKPEKMSTFHTETLGLDPYSVIAPWSVLYTQYSFITPFKSPIYSDKRVLELYHNTHPLRWPLSHSPPSSPWRAQDITIHLSTAAPSSHAYQIGDGVKQLEFSQCSLPVRIRKPLWPRDWREQQGQCDRQQAPSFHSPADNKAFFVSVSAKGSFKEGFLKQYNEIALQILMGSFFHAWRERYEKTQSHLFENLMSRWWRLRQQKAGAPLPSPRKSARDQNRQGRTWKMKGSSLHLIW